LLLRNLPNKAFEALQIGSPADEIEVVVVGAFDEIISISFSENIRDFSTALTEVFSGKRMFIPI